MAGKAVAPVRVIYVSMQMAQPTWRRLFSGAPFPPSQAAQKYHGLLARGLALSGAEVIAVTPPPVSRTTSKKRFLRLPREKAEGVDYRYLPIADLPVLRHGLICLTSFFTTLFLLNRRSYVLCDGLIVAASAGARAAAKLRGRPCAAIVTDVPEVLGGAENRVSRFNTRELARYDGYVLLAEAMSDRVNPAKRPYLVAEGLADGSMHSRHNIPAEKHGERVCLYAGMLHEKYGVLRLTEAFSSLPDPDVRLVIFGTGDAVDQVRAAEARDPRIQYRGVADNAAVVTEEIHATLLINPRPTDETFSKYSFPSKNLEYMASGTPLLTTRLPGMPAAYEPYVYLFQGETPAAMAQTLKAVLALPRETLHEKGLAAKSFVLTQKNNAVQAGRILTFLEELT